MVAPLQTAPPRLGDQATTQCIAPPNINGTTISRQWPRDKWLEAIWECTELTPNERIVAYVFARYSGKTDISWCNWDELIKRTGIKSKTTISKMISKLVNKRWMREDQPARQHFSARYQLTVPEGGGDSQTSTDWMSERARRTRGGRLAGAATAPDVQNMDVPDVHRLDPDIHFVDPSTQTESSDLQHGGTLPPDPLRTEARTDGPRAERIGSLTLVANLNDTQQVTSKRAAPNSPNSRQQLPIMGLVEGGLSDRIPIDPDQLDLIPAPNPPPELPADPRRAELWPVLAGQLTRINTRAAGGDHP